MQQCGRDELRSRRRPSKGMKVPDLLARVPVADVVRKVAPFGIGSKESPELFRREVGVAVAFSTAKAQVEHALVRKICG